MSPRKARIGSAITSASMRGRISTSIGIEAHGAQRVDLLAHLHRAELGGVGAARAAGDHDRDQQHADFAQHQHAEHVDDEDIGAELAEMEDALLGDDAADQEGDQHDDRHRAPAHLLEMMHGRGQAEAARMKEDPDAGAASTAPSMSIRDGDRAADAGDAAADLIEHAGDRRRRPRRRAGAASPGAPRRRGWNSSPTARRSWPRRCPGVRLRRSRSISQAPNVSSLETCETSMKMSGRLPASFSASATICSSTGAKRAVHAPAAHSARRAALRHPLQCRVAAHDCKLLGRSATHRMRIVAAGQSELAGSCRRNGG